MWTKNTPRRLLLLLAWKQVRKSFEGYFGLDHLWVWCKTIQFTFLMWLLKNEVATVKARRRSPCMCMKPEVAWSRSARVANACPAETSRLASPTVVVEITRVVQATHLRLWAVLLVSWFLLNFLHLAVCTGAMELSHIQALIDAAWNGLDVGDQLFLDGLQVESVLWCDEIDRQPQMTKPP